jgi:hypothetical protein
MVATGCKERLEPKNGQTFYGKRNAQDLQEIMDNNGGFQN